MKTKWNVKDPLSSITICRLISELEGATYLLDCMEDEEALFFLNDLKKKYYKLYFKKIKEEKNDKFP